MGQAKLSRFFDMDPGAPIYFVQIEIRDYEDKHSQFRDFSMSSASISVSDNIMEVWREHYMEDTYSWVKVSMLIRVHNEDKCPKAHLH